MSEPGRFATFPVLGAHGNEVTIAWSEQSVEAARLAAEAAPNMADHAAVKGLTPVGDMHVLVRTGLLQ